MDEQYLNGWIAAIDEMSRPGWREMHDRAMRDMAAGRGRDLDDVVKELEGSPVRGVARRRKPDRRFH
jgi:hypothetical protein